MDNEELEEQTTEQPQEDTQLPPGVKPLLTIFVDADNDVEVMPHDQLNASTAIGLLQLATQKLVALHYQSVMQAKAQKMATNIIVPQVDPRKLGKLK